MKTPERQDGIVPGVPIQDKQQQHVDVFHQMLPPPHQDLDGDKDDNIHNPDLDPVTEDNSDDSAAQSFDESDASSTEANFDNSNTDADDKYLHDNDNNNMDADDKNFLDEDMPNKDMLDNDVPDKEQTLDQETTYEAGRIDQLAEEDEQQSLETATYNLRPKRDRAYGFRLDPHMDDPKNDKSYKSHQFLQDVAKNEDEETVQSHTLREAVENRSDSSSHPAIVKSVVGIILNQMSAKVGIKKHGKVAVDALFNEILQLHDLHVFDPRSASSLTRAQKRAALRAISVIKEKRCGKIKGRTVANDRVQEGLYRKEKQPRQQYPPMH
jgi:hypothetical protein